MTTAAVETGLVESAGGRSGGGEVVLALNGKKTVAVRAAAHSPLRLLTPANSGHGAWVFASNFGGGLLAGDELSVDIEAEAGTTGYVSTQSSTKVYRSGDGRVSRNHLEARIGEGAMLAVMPDPVVCFAGARYRQGQRFEMAANGGLVLLDWFTSGRHGCGERWAAAEFRSSNEVWVDGRCVLRDRLRLEPGGVGVGMGTFNCLATVVLVGKRVEAGAGELLAWVKGQRLGVREKVIVGASAIAGGVIFRVAGVNVEEVGKVVFARLGFVGELLGECPWKRKW